MTHNEWFISHSSRFDGKMSPPPVLHSRLVTPAVEFRKTPRADEMVCTAARDNALVAQHPTTELCEDYMLSLWCAVPRSFDQTTDDCLTRLLKMIRYALAGLLLVALAGTAVAQEFYIVRGADKKCGGRRDPQRRPS